MKKVVPVLVFIVSIASLRCAASKSAPVASSPAPGAASPAATPTPGPVARVNPDVIEETETYTIQRLRKSDYIRVDDRHIRHPVVARPIEFFREDENYYYVYVRKFVPAEDAARREIEQKERTTAEQATPPQPEGNPAARTDYGMPPADFEDLTPRRVPGRLKLETVRSSGLPPQGMWRASFVLADFDRDGKLDIVAPPARLGGDATLHVYAGDGTGRFRRMSLKYTEDGRPKPNFSLAYGGVAVGDIDGDGNEDVVAAGHAAGLTSLFGDGRGSLAIVRKGLPGRDFSAQAVVLVDVDGDGKLDIVASEDSYSYSGRGWDPHQVRVFLFKPGRTWEASPDALTDAAYSNSLSAWDYNGDGKKDVLTASHAYGTVQFLWKNGGNGKFTTGYFPQIEIHGYHFGMAPGTFGKDRAPAFADAFSRATNTPVQRQAEGITVYEYRGAAWTRHRVWRKKEGKSFLYGIAMGDMDGDGLDDVVFPDSEASRLRVFFQEPDGGFVEAAEPEEPQLDSPGQCVRVGDLNGDGKLDLVLSKTISSGRPSNPGGWEVYLNRR